MKRMTVLLFALLLLVPVMAQDAGAAKEAPARLETRVIQLKGVALGSAYRSAIDSIVAEDYSRTASVQYDEQDNVLVITATPITIEKVERFLNKIDFPAEGLTFLTLVLRVNGEKSFDAKLDADVKKELKEIGISGARIVYQSRMQTISGKPLSFSMTPENGEGYSIGFRPVGRRASLMLDDFTVNKLVPAKNTPEKTVYDRWNVLHTTFPITEGKPVVVGISSDKTDGVILAIKLLKLKK